MAGPCNRDAVAPSGVAIAPATYRRQHPLLAVISTFPPTRCGLATYADDLIHALCATAPQLELLRVRVVPLDTDDSGAADLVVRRSPIEAWGTAASWLLEHGVDVALVQHEYKVFGGPYGRNILRLMEQRPCAFIVTLHSVSRRLRGPRLDILRRVCDASDHIVVHLSESKEVLQRFGMDGVKIHVIPHGIPTVPFDEPQRFSLDKKPILLSFGHLRRGKGYELAIGALAKLRDDGIPFDYWIYGKDHPRRKTSGSYRSGLAAQVREMALDDCVHFVDSYLPAADLVRIVKTCDLGILPYTRSEQASSGTLALFLACGRPVIASSFRAARQMVDAGCGKLFPVGSVDPLYLALKEVIGAVAQRKQMMHRANEKAQPWAWEVVARQYLNIISVVLGITAR
jgi:glycosyltransferase involved in cell wall biosynthesis